MEARRENVKTRYLMSECISVILRRKGCYSDQREE
jgi:hypothetical protein